MIRTGIGYDSHRFVEGRPLILGGVTIPFHLGLAGHSDADAVAHALTDALLGGAGLGDIGSHFPDTDDQWKDADSMLLLASAVKLVRQSGWTPSSCDVTIIAEAPKLLPHVAQIKSNCATALGITAADVGMKGKTNEGMGFIGRGEGIAVIAVATLTALS